MEELIGILEETPWWVYLILIYIVYMGVKAGSPRTIAIRKLVLLPLALTVWGLMGMAWTLTLLLLWAGSLIIGFGLGWFSVRKWKIRYDRGRGTLHLPGSYSTLILALLFFCIKYFFGYYNATHPEPAQEVLISQAAVSGVISGMFIGRLALFWKKYEAL